MVRSSDESALLVAGAFGGPFTIALYTPLRNAITLGSKDPIASAAALYRRTVEHGWLHGGYAGWMSPTIFSCPQFLAMGPMYHVYAGVVGTNLAHPAPRSRDGKFLPSFSRPGKYQDNQQHDTIYLRSSNV